MDFRVKCAIQHLLSVVPGGRHLNYLMQRLVTHSLPQSDRELARNRAIAAQHLENYVSLRGSNPANIYEFGAGWDLAIAVILGVRGCRVTTIDVSRNARPYLVNDMLRRNEAESLDKIGVTYVSPCDARSTGLTTASFNLVMSTSVLEHVPPEDIPPILKECRRLLAPGGLCSFLVDYGDHWSYFDQSIPWDNFLRYSEREWALYNPPLQYQNRLRHSHYGTLFKDAGFETVSVERFGPEGVVPIDDRTTASAFFVLA